MVLSAYTLSLIVYVAFHNAAYRNVYKRFKQYRRQRYGFYECGFRPKHEVSAEISVFTYVMLALVVLYDVEGVFLLFFAACLDALSLGDILVVLLYVASFLCGLLLEVVYGSTSWQLY